MIPGLTRTPRRCSNRSVNVSLSNLVKFPKINISIEGFRPYIAEFLATFIFVFIASGVTISDLVYDNIGTIGVATAIGFSYGALIFTTIRFGTGFLNPAITLSLWLTQKLTGVKTVLLILLQLLASFSAAYIVFLIFGQNALDWSIGAPALGINISQETAVLVEAIVTAAMVFAVYSTSVDKSGPTSFGPLVLGLILTSVSILAFPITGASFNPSRAVGPLVLVGEYQTLAPFVIGPLLGSLFGPVYEVFFLRKPSKTR